MDSLPQKSLVSCIILFILLNGISLNTLKSSSQTAAEPVLIESKPINMDIDILGLINEVNETNLDTYIKELISFGPRPAGRKPVNKQGHILPVSFPALGLMSRLKTGHSSDPFTECSGDPDGSDNSSDAEFLLSAHYDTRRTSIGANDDASGIASILAIARSAASITSTIPFVSLHYLEKNVGCVQTCQAAGTMREKLMTVEITSLHASILIILVTVKLTLVHEQSESIRRYERRGFLS